MFLLKLERVSRRAVRSLLNHATHELEVSSGRLFASEGPWTQADLFRIASPSSWCAAEPAGTWEGWSALVPWPLQSLQPPLAVASAGESWSFLRPRGATSAVRTIASVSGMPAATKSVSASATTPSIAT